jgi:translation initiation factor 5A
METEGETKKVDAGGIKAGNFIIMENAACKVVDVQISKSGKHGHAKARITAVGLLDGKKRVEVMPCHDTVEVPIISKKSAQILSIIGDKASVMDVETYETFELDIPDELRGQVAEGTQVLFWTVLGQKVMKQVKGAE